MNSPDLSVVVVHHRGQEHLLETLAGLAASSAAPSFETILVDNTAGQPMEEVLRRHSNVRRVVAGKNAGFAAGCRLGAEAARAPLLVFVNDDAAVLPDALGLLAGGLGRGPGGVAGGAGGPGGRGRRGDHFSPGGLSPAAPAPPQKPRRP